MFAKRKSKIEKLELIKKAGLIKTSEAKKNFGISQPTLSRWAKLGLIEKIGQGLYLHPDSSIDYGTLDFSIACSTFGPRSFIGGLSALYYYGLIEQPPQQVWVLVPPEKVSRNLKFRCLRTINSFRFGIKKLDYFRISSIERAIIESLKYASKIGERNALHAARKALKQGLTSEVKLGQMATLLKLGNVLKKYWESIVP